MAEDLKAPHDPHNILNSRWPRESERQCAAVSATLRSWQTIHMDGAAATVPTAQAVSDGFRGLTGGALAEDLALDYQRLTKAHSDAGVLAGLMSDVSQAITSAKLDIRAAVAEGTEKVDAAKEKDRQGVIDHYREQVATRADELDSKLHQLGREMSAGVPGTVPTKSGAGVYLVPQSDGTYQAVSAKGQAVNADGRVTGDKPTTRMPDKLPAAQDNASTPKPKSAASTPSAPSSPSSPAGSAPMSPGQMPQMNTPGQTSPASGGTPSNAGTPSTGGSPSSTSSPSSGSADSKSDGGSQSGASNDPGLSGAMTPTLNPNQTPANTANTGTPANTATSATSAAAPIAAKAGSLPSMAMSGAAPTTALSGLSGMSAPTSAAGMGSLASTAPAGTGVTPGSPGVGVKAGVGVVAPVAPVGGVGPVGPVAPAVQTGTVVGTAGPVGGGGVGPGLPGGGGAAVLSGGGAGSPLGGGSSTVVLPQHLTSASTAIGDQDRSSVMGLSSYVRSLDLPDQIAHRRLAGFVGSLRQTGWAQMPVAVGVYLIRPYGQPAGAPEILIGVLATADGVCLLPPGVSVPAGLIPVTQVPGITPGAVAAMAGYVDPARKLVELVPKGYGELVALVGVEDVDVSEVLRCGDQAPAVSGRSAFGRLGTAEMTTRVDGEINAAIMKMGRPSVAEAGRELRALRWSAEDGGKPRGYDLALRRWYLADALSYAGTDRGEAAFGVGELMMSPELERDR